MLQEKERPHSFNLVDVSVGRVRGTLCTPQCTDRGRDFHKSRHWLLKLATPQCNPYARISTLTVRVGYAPMPLRDAEGDFTWALTLAQFVQPPPNARTELYVKTNSPAFVLSSRKWTECSFPHHAVELGGSKL